MFIASPFGPGRTAPGREHGLVGLRPGLAPPPHARHHDEHEHGDDDDQDDKKHVPLLPATRGNWLPSAADPRCLLSRYFGTKKLAIFFYKLGCPSGGGWHFLVSPARSALHRVRGDCCRRGPR